MALSKQQVEQAKLALLARQQYPSVDAVRIELGNTGSKSTIHKYLKELETEQQTSAVNPPNLSETIQNFVAQLAKQLQSEADQRIYEHQQQSEKKERSALDQIEQLKQTQSTLEDELNKTKHQLKLSEKEKSQANADLHQEQLVRQKFEQHAEDLISQLKQSEQHHQDLLAKFNHAQQSLEHYRESVKEQRQQELRRHDSAIQHLQNEIRHLQQTIMIEKQKTTELDKAQLVLQSEISMHQQTIEKYHLDFANLKDHQQQTEILYQGVLGDYEAQKNLNQQQKNSILSMQIQLSEQQKVLDQQQNYQDLHQQNLVMSTEVKLLQKMYNDLINSVSISQIKKD